MIVEYAEVIVDTELGKFRVRTDFQDEIHIALWTDMGVDFGWHYMHIWEPHYEPEFIASLKNIVKRIYTN